MRAVIYARYSTDLQAATSIEDQFRVCRERIKREGWTYAHAYHDRAMSGTSHLRPGYQKLLEDARAGVFDIVVAEALDRLSRDQEHVAHLYKHLTFAGVRLVTLSEGVISELHVGLSGTMGALYVKQLAERTHRGLRGRVEAGRSGGGNSYGYDVVSRTGADREPVGGIRAINPQQAEIVCRILQAYAHGEAPRSIAKMLNLEGLPGPSGGTWGPSTINGNASRGTGILNNELYVGKFVWNRLKYLKNPNTGKRQSRLNRARRFRHRCHGELPRRVRPVGHGDPGFRIHRLRPGLPARSCRRTLPPDRLASLKRACALSRCSSLVRSASLALAPRGRPHAEACNQEKRGNGYCM
jgi:site-specific DNA recombinase